MLSDYSPLVQRLGYYLVEMRVQFSRGLLSMNRLLGQLQEHLQQII